MSRAVMMEANEVVRMALADDLAMWIVLLLAIAGAVLGIMYLARAWSWRPRRKQRSSFGERTMNSEQWAVDNGQWIRETIDGTVWYRRVS